jgi:intracellular septation protein A
LGIAFASSSKCCAALDFIVASVITVTLVAVSKSLLDLKSALTRISSIVFSAATLATGIAIRTTIRAGIRAKLGLGKKTGKRVDK